MPTKTKDNETYWLVTADGLTQLGFFRKVKDPYSWFLYPTKSVVQTFDFSEFELKQKKSFDNMNHIHVITIDLGDDDLGLREIKLKSHTTKGGWWLKRNRGTGLFRLSANRAKEAEYFRDDPGMDGKRHYFLTDAADFNYSRVTPLLGMLPATWLHAEKPVVKSAKDLIASKTGTT